MPFTIDGTPSWLTLSAAAGNAPTTVNATVDVAGLPLGTLTAELVTLMPIGGPQGHEYSLDSRGSERNVL